MSGRNVKDQTAPAREYYRTVERSFPHGFAQGNLVPRKQVDYALTISRHAPSLRKLQRCGRLVFRQWIEGTPIAVLAERHNTPRPVVEEVLRQEAAA